MRWEIVSDIVFWCLAAIGSALVVALVLVVGGAIPVSSPAEEGLSTEVAAPPRETSAAATTTAVPDTGTTTASRSESPSRPSTTPSADVPVKAVVVVTASRGESWFSARLGSEQGRVLDERILAQGQSVRLEGPRIWLSVGAAGNVDLTVNGKARNIAPGTVELVLTRTESTS